MKLSKSLSILIVFFFLFFLVGCSKPEEVATNSIVPATVTSEDTPLPANTPTQTLTPTPTQKPAPLIKVCQVTDTGGIGDHSMNENIWAGIQRSVNELNIEGKYLEARAIEDYEKHINTFIFEKCDVIIGVGYSAIDQIRIAASNHPEIKFILIGSPLPLNLQNVSEIEFQYDEAAFLAGYVAADIAVKTAEEGTVPAVATFGGMSIPSDTIYMDGFARGVSYYAEKKGIEIKSLGWSLKDPSKGKFINSYGDKEKGKMATAQFIDEGAKVIFPIAGMGGMGAAETVMENGNTYLIGVSSDWYYTLPDYKEVILTSVMPNLSNVVYSEIQSVLNNSYSGGVFVADLSNGGVEIAPFHDNQKLISSELMDELGTLKDDIISGKILLNNQYAIKK